MLGYNIVMLGYNNQDASYTISLKKMHLKNMSRMSQKKDKKLFYEVTIC